MSYRGQHKGSYGNQKRGSSGFWGRFRKGQTPQQETTARVAFDKQDSPVQDMLKIGAINSSTDFYLVHPGAYEWYQWLGFNIPKALNDKKRAAVMVLFSEKTGGPVELEVQEKIADGKTKTNRFKISRRDQVTGAELRLGFSSTNPEVLKYVQGLSNELAQFGFCIVPETLEAERT